MNWVKVAREAHPCIFEIWEVTSQATCTDMMVHVLSIT